MNTIKIYLAESGRVADLKKDFPLYQYQFQNKLLNVFVPTSILAPDFQSQSATGEVLADYVAGTSVKIGMSYTSRDGSIKVSKNYYMRYLKTLTYQNIEYALYERKLPKEFTNYAGQGANAPILTINIVNIQEKSEDGTPIVLSVTATQTCSLDVMKSTSLDNDEAVEPTELENINAEINSINAILPTKQDKVDENLGTANKSVVGAINENKSRIDVNTTNIQTNTQNISRNRSDIDLLIARMKLSEDYIGQLTGEELPTNSELNAFVKANTLPSRDPRNGDVIIFIQQIEGATDKNYKYFYSQMDWQHYEIPPIESASNGTLGLVSGTYIIGSEISEIKDTLVDIIDGEILNIYVMDRFGVYRNIVEYLNGTSKTTEKLKTQLNALTDTVAELETADTQNVKLTGDQVIQGIKNFVGTLQVNGENITNVIGDLAISQQIELGADGIIESNNITYTVQNAEDYLPYRTNLRKFILNLHLPVSGEVGSTFPVNITFGDTTYYVYNIINNSRITWADLLSNTTQSAEGFTTIIEATMLITESLVGFYIILPTYASATTDIKNIVNNTTKIADALYGGFAGGRGSTVEAGGAIGNSAYASQGGAIGWVAHTLYGGAIGWASSSGNGGAVGYASGASSGGAVGQETQTSAGFAGGYRAKTIDENNHSIDAIQLGTGTNQTEKSLQVYDYPLMNADGTIPLERMANETTARTEADNALQEQITEIGGNYVTLDTAQTITGSKTFSAGFSSSGERMIQLQQTTDSGGTTPDYIHFLKDNDSVGNIYYFSNRLHIRGNIAITNLGNNDIINFVDQSVYPGVNNITLGKSTNMWKDLYLSGNLTDGTNTTTIASIPVEIETTVDPTNYVMTTNLKNASGTVVSTGTVDLPLESVVVGGEYNAETKKVVLTLQNGNTIEFSVEDLINGLASQADVDNIVNNTTKIINSSGGFSGGRNSNAVNGGAIGAYATTNEGGAVGYVASATSGGAVGNNAKSGYGFAGGYYAKATDTSGNGIDAIQLGTGTNNTPKTLQIYDFQLMDASGNIPLERMVNETSARESADAELQNQIVANTDILNSVIDDIENIVNNTTLIHSSGGGFAGGTDAQLGTVDYGAAIGKGAYANMGGAVGNTAYTSAGGAVGGSSHTINGGAIGYTAYSNTGGAVGQAAYAVTGGAIGLGATTTSGFAGGSYAKTQTSAGTIIDAIQLGTGTNPTEKSLQIYNYTLMNADGTVPLERMSQMQTQIDNTVVKYNESQELTEDAKAIARANIGAISSSEVVSIDVDSALNTISTNPVQNKVVTQKFMNIESCEHRLCNSNYGFQAGINAITEGGGAAVGMNTRTGDGFAGGKNACTIDNDNNAIDAIQLGTGTNTIEKSLKVYDYELMDTNGYIPSARLPQLVTLWSGSIGATTTLTLNGNINSFRYIILEGIQSTSLKNTVTTFIPRNNRESLTVYLGANGTNNAYELTITLEGESATINTRQNAFLKYIYAIE